MRLRPLFACLIVLATSATLSAKDRTLTAVYCAQSPTGTWGLQRFKPLIRVEGGTVFTEMTFMGSVLGEVKLRRFYPDSELAFEYRFDSAGKLTALKGSLTVFNDWLAEAELMPDADGKIPPYHVMYSKDKDRVEKPENAGNYIGRLDEAPIYRTIQALPCAAMLKEAEKMNATQE